MKHTLTFSCAMALMTAALLLNAAGCGDEQCFGHGDGAPCPEENGGVPDEFANLDNPFDGDETAIAAGAAIYDGRCASCHGPTGLGDGPAAESLDPAATNLTEGHVKNATDGYLFFRVSEGGVEPFNSAMPGFDGQLSEDEIWQVVSHMRGL